MSEYIITHFQSKKQEIPDAYEFVTNDGEEIEYRQIVRCKDCKHATISSLGYVKYCEKFVLPDEDGYGADPQVMLPLDFFCGYGELRGDA